MNMEASNNAEQEAREAWVKYYRSQQGHYDYTAHNLQGLAAFQSRLLEELEKRREQSEYIPTYTTAEVAKIIKELTP